MIECLKLWSKLLIVPIILMAALIAVLASRKITSNKSEFIRIPQFELKDDSGRLLKREILKNKYVLVQFLSTKGDIDILRQIFFEWESEIVVFIAVCNEAIARYPNTPAERPNFHVVSVDKKSISAAFSNPRAGAFYLYDLSGRLAGSGTPSDNSRILIKKIFNRLINGKYFNLAELLGTGENILKLEWFSQVSQFMIKEKKEYYAIGMFRNICQGCGSGSIIRVLNDAYRDKKEKLGLICFVDDSFSDADVRSLRSQLEIDYCVAVANELLSSKWEALVREYTASELTDIVFLIDLNGRLLRTMDPSCSDCAWSLYTYLREL
jgi:hypothetical protein